MWNEIRGEIIYVLTLWIILSFGLMIVDIQHRWRSYPCDWTYVIEPVDGWAIAATNGDE